MFTEVQYQAKLQCVGVRWLTSAAQRVGGAQTVVSWLAAVTAGTLYIHFALTGSCAVITPAAVHCPLGTADTAWRQRHQHGLSTNVQCDLQSETWYTEMLGGFHLRMQASGRSIRLRGFGWYPAAHWSHFGPVVWCIQFSHTPPLLCPLASYSAQSNRQRCAWLLHSQPEDKTKHTQIIKMKKFRD